MDDTRISKKIKRLERKGQRSGGLKRCSLCLYTSERLYNIIRHEFRIHRELSKSRQCCGIFFTTKGDFYIHCEEFHPESRVNRMSRMKYKIFSSNGIRQRSIDCKITNESVSRIENNEKSTRAPYILRSSVRALRKFGNSMGYEESELSECESNFDYPTMEEKSTITKSSGYATKSSSSSSSYTASESSLKIHTEASSPIDFDPSDEQKINVKNDDYELKITPKKSNDSKICTRGQTHDSGIANRPISSTDTSVNPENIYHESETNIDDVNKSLNFNSPSVNDDDDDAWKYFDSGTFVTSTPANLPIKKRILRQLSKNNGENIIETRKSFGDRLYRKEKNETRVSVKIRKKSRVIKKGLACCVRRNSKSGGYTSTASSDTENVSPIVGEQKSLVSEVNIRMDPRIIWQDVTRLQRDYLRAINFDSLTE